MMRLVAALLLVLSCGLGHASAIICEDQVYWTDTTNPKCPPKITNPSIINITQTGFTITGTGDASTAGSTVSAWVSSTATFPPGCSSLNYDLVDLTDPVVATRQAAVVARQACMKWPEITAGTDATLSASAAVPDAGVFNLNVTGGVPDTTYTVWHLNKGGVNGKGKISVLSEHTVTTSATPGGGDPEPELPGERLVEDGGEVRYISSVDGNDLDYGTTPALAWARLDKWLCNLPAGTNIALWHQSVFSLQKFRICHTGQPTNWNIIGSFKLNGSSEPIWTTDGIFGESTTDQKAELRGSMTVPGLTAGSIDYPSTFPYDGYVADWDFMMTVDNNADYTELLNIEMSLHRWSTLRVGDGYGDLEYIIMDGMDFIDAGNSGYTYGVVNGVVRNSSFIRMNTCYGQRQQPGNTGSEAVCQGPWGGGFTFVAGQNQLMEDSFFQDIYGEAFDIFTRMDDVIVRNNVIDNYIAVCIYGDSANDMVVEGNVCTSRIAGNVGYSGSQALGIDDAYDTAWGGIWSDMEYYFSTAPGPGDNKNVTVRNNIVMNAVQGIENAQWQNLVNTDPNATRKSSGYYNGNTVIASRDAGIQFWQGITSSLITTRVPYFYAKNNVFWDNRGSVSCLWNQLHSLVDITYSYFTTTQADGDCAGTGDIVASNPELVVSNIDTWRNNASVPVRATFFANARPDPDSPIRNTGVVSEDVIYTAEQFGFALDQVADIRSGAITKEHWLKERYYCGLNEACGPTPPIGAMCPAAGCTDAPVVTPSAVALTISPNGKYFRKNGSPFNWIGCTGWLSSDLSTADMTTFLEDQAGRGCNVVHGPIMNSILDAADSATGPISSTSPYTMRTSFFSSKVDWWVSEATRLGMNIAFPLAWGPNCKRDMVDLAANATTYAAFVVGRYASYPNIVWIACGEYTKMSTNSPDYLANSDEMDSNEIAILDALIAATNANKHADQLVTIHPDGWASSTDTGRHPSRNYHTLGVIDFNTQQSGSNFAENITDTEYDTQLSPQRPVVAMEPLYEEGGGIVGDGGTISPWHMRMFAWQSRLSGSAGFTYGHSCVWYFCTGWAGQLADAGATDIFTHFKGFWDTHHDEGLIRSRDWLTGDKGTNNIQPSLNTYQTALRSADGTKLIVYSPQGYDIHVVTTNLSGSVRARWFDPANGGYTAISDPVTKSADTTFNPSGTPGVENDWVLVLD